MAVVIITKVVASNRKEGSSALKMFLISVVLMRERV